MKKESQFYYENPEYVAEQIKLVVDIMLNKMSLEAKVKAYPNLKRKLMQLNVSEMSTKSSKGGAPIGASLSLIKNVLNGKDPSFINQTLNELGKRL